MTALYVAIGALLGAMGALSHLAITRWRAGVATGGKPGAALVGYPLGLAALGACVYAAIRIDPAAGWATLVGIALARYIVLARIASRST